MSSDMHDEKSEAVFARLIPTEKRVLLAIARAERRNVSETLRELIRAEAKRRGLWPNPIKEVRL